MKKSIMSTLITSGGGHSFCGKAFGQIKTLVFEKKNFSKLFWVEENTLIQEPVATEKGIFVHGKPKKAAFTLAEVLITLGIIGVVAALTIPTLVQNYQEKATVTKVKKMYSTLSNAYQLAILDYGTAGQWGITGRDAGNDDENTETYYATNAILVRDRLLKNAKTVKLCDNAKDQKSCGIADKIYHSDGSVDTHSSGLTARTASALLADGSSVYTIANGGSEAVRGSGELSHVYADIHYDINGIKPPNTYGKDIFTFHLTENSIIPFGTANDSMFTFANECLAHRGLGCTAWVIYNGNMDYLHCNDLSWDDKHKCD